MKYYIIPWRIKRIKKINLYLYLILVMSLHPLLCFCIHTFHHDVRGENERVYIEEVTNYNFRNLYVRNEFELVKYPWKNPLIVIHSPFLCFLVLGMMFLCLRDSLITSSTLNFFFIRGHIMHIGMIQLPLS